MPAEMGRSTDADGEGYVRSLLRVASAPGLDTYCFIDGFVSLLFLVHVGLSFGADASLPAGTRPNNITPRVIDRCADWRLTIDD